MPIYEYNCPKCGHFEAMHSASDKPLKAKPDCEHKDCPKKAERLISAAAFHLKGGGWYKDGYGASAAKPSQAGGGKSDGAGASESSTGTSAVKESKKESLKTVSDSKPAAGGGCGGGCKCH